MKSTFHALASALAAAVLVVTLPANAAEPDAAKAEAESRFAEGLTQYQQKDYEGARLKFAQAYAVLSSVDILYNLAASEVRSGHALESIVHLRQLMRDPRSTEVDRVKARKLLAEANSLTGHVRVEAPDGAVVTLDQVPSGEAPIREPLDVRPGKHVVAARLRDGTRTLEITVPIGEVVTARFSVDASSPTASAPVPVASVPAPALAATAIEPAPTPSRFTYPPALPPDHDVRQPRPVARIVVPIALGALAVAAGVTGAAFALDSRSGRDKVDAFRAAQPRGFCLDAASDTCARYHGLIDDEDRSATLSRVFYATGAVLAVGAVASFVFWPRTASAPRSAWIAPTPGGVRVSGTF
jgi:hypothetical protein